MFIVFAKIVWPKNLIFPIALVSAIFMVRALDFWRKRARTLVLAFQACLRVLEKPEWTLNNNGKTHDI